MLPLVYLNQVAQRGANQQEKQELRAVRDQVRERVLAAESPWHGWSREVKKSVLSMAETSVALFVRASSMVEGRRDRQCVVARRFRRTLGEIQRSLGEVGVLRGKPEALRGASRVVGTIRPGKQDTPEGKPKGRRSRLAACDQRREAMPRSKDRASGDENPRTGREGTNGRVLNQDGSPVSVGSIQDPVEKGIGARQVRFFFTPPPRTRGEAHRKQESRRRRGSPGQPASVS
jgi:hypothetical protein